MTVRLIDVVRLIALSAVYMGIPKKASFDSCAAIFGVLTLKART